MPYPVAAARGKMFGGGVTIPWYLTGGIAAANCKIAYKPIGAANLAASYINLANPGTNNAAPGVAPTFNTITGWAFNGTSQYLDTGYSPGNTSERTIIIRISGGAVDLKRWPCGARSGSNWFAIGSANSGFSGLAVYAHGSASGFAATAVSAGVMAIAKQDAYLDGVDIGNITGTFFDVSAVTMHIGNCSGISGEFYSGNVLAFAEYDITLTPTQVAAISAAMAGF